MAELRTRLNQLPNVTSVDSNDLLWISVPDGSGGYLDRNITAGDLNIANSVTRTGIPEDNQVAVWTGTNTIEGTSNFTYSGTNLQFTGDLGATGSRITKGWFTDLQVTNAIIGSVTGNAATVTTNANLTGDVTSVGNATAIASNVIVDADINASAGILLSKTNMSLTTTGTSGAATLNTTTGVLNIPNYTTGGGTPGGSTTQVQYNNAGAFGGISRVTTNGTNIAFSGSTSGSTTIQATAIAGTTTLTLPAATDTLIGKATTDTLTNKTFDTAGTGNSFSINGVAATANTGTGAVVRATSPTLVTPSLGVATGTSFNGVALTTGGSASNFLNAAGSYVAVSGIPQVTTTATTSGTSIVITVDFTTNEEYEFFFDKVGVGGGGDTLTVEASSNGGSSYGTSTYNATRVSLAVVTNPTNSWGSAPASDPCIGFMKISQSSTTGTVRMVAQSGNISGNITNVAVCESSLSAAANRIRFATMGGTAFNAGSITYCATKRR